MRLASRDNSYSDMLFAVKASTPIEQRLTEALAECDRLREENRQLRVRLGISRESKSVQTVPSASKNGRAVISSSRNKFVDAIGRTAMTGVPASSSRISPQTRRLRRRQAFPCNSPVIHMAGKSGRGV